MNVGEWTLASGHLKPPRKRKRETLLSGSQNRNTIAFSSVPKTNAITSCPLPAERRFRTWRWLLSGAYEIVSFHGPPLGALHPALSDLPPDVTSIQTSVTDIAGSYPRRRLRGGRCGTRPDWSEPISHRGEACSEAYWIGLHVLGNRLIPDRWVWVLCGRAASDGKTTSAASRGGRNWFRFEASKNARKVTGLDTKIAPKGRREQFIAATGASSSQFRCLGR